MPNGSDLPQGEFEALERPLLRIDAAIEDFARQKEARIIKNYHNSPDRHVDWRDASGITRTILISPVSKYSARIGNVQRWTEYSLTVVAHKDYPDLDRPNPIDPMMPRLRRKWWYKKIAEMTELPQDDREFTRLLETAYEELKVIEEQHLMPVS